MLKIFGSPGRYIQGPDACLHLGAAAATLGERAALVADPFVAEMTGKRLADVCAAKGVAVATVIMDGEITPETVGRLVDAARRTSPDFVIAVGGGKSIDAGKAISHALGLRLITVPTVASNDSPTSKNYVLYDDDHKLLAVEHLTFSPAYVIVDTVLIARAPSHLFRAGLGDAISKKFEAEQCYLVGGLTMFDAAPTLTAQSLADLCYRVLRQDAVAALAVAGSGAPNPPFERSVEAMILMSGLGFESGGLSLAHALTRGLSILPGAKLAPHGYQVALGLLIQLALEERDDEILDEMLSWYAELGLPTSLEDLGSEQTPTDEDLEQAARLTVAARHTRNFKRKVEPADFVRYLRHFSRRRVVAT
jgi:glycerol dehydrogenase